MSNQNQQPDRDSHESKPISVSDFLQCMADRGFSNVEEAEAAYQRFLTEMPSAWHRLEQAFYRIRQVVQRDDFPDLLAAVKQHIWPNAPYDEPRDAGALEAFLVNRVTSSDAQQLTALRRLITIWDTRERQDPAAVAGSTSNSNALPVQQGAAHAAHEDAALTAIFTYFADHEEVYFLLSQALLSHYSDQVWIDQHRHH